MTKKDFADHGLAVVLPDETAFASGLTALGFSASPEPTAVIVKNSSQHNVAALAVEFVAATADGSFVPIGGFAYYSPASLVDVGNPNRPVQAPVLGLYPGSSILIGTGGPLDASGRNAPSISYSVKPRSPVVDVQVKVDSVVFDNGNAWGPDNRQVIAKLREHILAQQDLAQEIIGRLTAGESLHAVLEELSSKLPQDNDFRRGVHSKNLSTLYLSVRQSYLHRLNVTYANMGQEAAMRKLGEITFSVRPTIQQKGEN
jgi:hypothetical protein